ncbi:MAG: ATP-binding protein, partial [Pseudolabrys sp.]
TKSHQGSGLGLALAKSLVELHGGKMRIRSVLGRGTIVVVRLPLQPCCPLPKEQAA